MTVKLVQQDLLEAPTVEAQDAILKSAYASGFTLQELGDIVGVTRERIRQRIARPVPFALMKDYPPHERVRRKTVQAKRKRSKQKRILGLRLSSPALQVPVETVTRLAELHSLVTTVRGWTPLDDPARQAVKPFGDLLYKTMVDYEIPQKHLEKLLGLKGATLTAWLRSHGYLKQMPSQTSYQGVVIDHKRTGRPAGPELVPGATCRRGHLMTEENIGIQKVGRYCKNCSRDRARERYQKRKQLNKK